MPFPLPAARLHPDELRQTRRWSRSLPPSTGRLRMATYPGLAPRPDSATACRQVDAVEVTAAADLRLVPGAAAVLRVRRDETGWSAGAGRIERSPGVESGRERRAVEHPCVNDYAPRVR